MNLWADISNVRVLLVSSGILALAMVCGLLVHALLASIVRRRHARAPFSIRGITLPLPYVVGPFRALLPGLAVAMVLPFLRFPAPVRDAIGHGVLIWLIGVFAWLSTRAVAMARDMVMSHYQLSAKDNLQARRVYTQLRVMERILAVLITFFAVSLILMTFPAVRRIGTTILASAGVLGIVAGFAAQRSLGTLVAGIQIALSQPMRIDDVVIVEGEWGRIEEITLTYVVVRIWDDRRLVVPVTYFIERPFQNWTRTAAQLLGTVLIHADYTLPIQAVREELHRILTGTPLWDGRAWGLQVTDATEHTIELRALMSAADSSALWDLRCLVREQLIEFLQTQYPEHLPRVRMEMGQGRPQSRVRSSGVSHGSR